jgi:hypothetical protein
MAGGAIDTLNANAANVANAATTPALREKAAS